MTIIFSKQSKHLFCLFLLEKIIYQINLANIYYVTQIIEGLLEIKIVIIQFKFYACYTIKIEVVELDLF